jgi:uroporphyrin-III C-methyltransferase
VTDNGADIEGESGTDTEIDNGDDIQTDTGTGPGPDYGTVTLVGSGPGDPDLLTVAARDALDAADVILHDRLPGPVLDTLPANRLEDVGKDPDGERTSQAKINERLVDHARAGRDVVRLKGGDPFVFGRGGEEAAYLADHDVPFEVVPGVTSAFAAPAAAGIPVTHRDHASSVSVVTGHEDPTKDESAIDWTALAETGGTLVVLMGVGRLPDYAAALVDGGRAPETPLALIERGTWPDQRVATGTLGTAAETRDDAGIEPPAAVVIGDVAASRDRVLPWLRGLRSAPDRGAAGQSKQ